MTDGSVTMASKKAHRRLEGDFLMVPCVLNVLLWLFDGRSHQHAIKFLAEVEVFQRYCSVLERTRTVHTVATAQYTAYNTVQ